jgi:predicted ATPase/DNA-binding SARP family transcriptional activator
MEFLVLGPLEIRKHGQPVRVRASKERALLAVLLLHPNEVVSRDRLIGALWGERPPATAANAVQVYVSQLRKALGEKGRLLTRAPGYVLEVPAGASDLERFDDLAERGRAALEAGSPEDAARMFGEALALWRGPALADVELEGPLRLERERLEESRLDVLEDRIEAELALGHHGELVGELERLVVEHPYRERLRGQLILALYRAGRQAEALEVYRRTRRTLVDELGIEPGPALARLEQAILRQEPALDFEAPRPSGSLPSPPTPLIGRERELVETTRLLSDPQVRLVTLTGPPGTGKTRLTLELAARAAEHFPDGVFFVALASLAAPDLVGSEVAQALDVREHAARPVEEALERRLRDRQTLLVLDNFEHLLPSAPLVSRLLRAAPALKIVVTSRAVLHLSGEHEFPVPPLDGEYSMALFVQRATAVQNDFALTAENAGTVASICARLDGLPLAIELAAAKTKLLGPAALLERLERPLALLTGGPRDLPARQQALLATLEWSYGLLQPVEQALFARVGVFAGAFTLPAAEAVSGGEVLGGLASLVDESLLRRLPGSDEPRFSMLRTIREYALARLEEADEAEEIRRRHASYFTSLAEHAEPELNGDASATWIRRLDAEHDNFRAALEWTSRVREQELSLRLAGALGRFWYIRGHLSEGRRWLEAALAAGDEQGPLRVKALTRLAVLGIRQGRLEESKAALEEALALARPLDDKEEIGLALGLLAHVAARARDFETALADLSEAEALYRELGDVRGIAISLGNRSVVTTALGDVEGGVALASESLALHCELGDQAARVVMLFTLGFALLAGGRPDEAVARISEGYGAAVDLGFREELVYGLIGMGVAAAAYGDLVRAARLLGAAEAAGEEIGLLFDPVEIDLAERTAAAVRAELGEAEADSLWAEGRALALDDAVELARSVAAPT